MKTGTAAGKIGINTRTLDTWLKRPEYEEFFSDSAKTSGGEYRDLTEEDVVVLNTINIHRRMSHAHEDIADLMRSGHREHELPLSSIFTEAATTAEQFALAVRITQENALLVEDITALEAQIADLMKRLDQMAEDKIKDHEEIGRLRGQLEVYQQIVAGKLSTGAG